VAAVVVIPILRRLAWEVVVGAVGVVLSLYAPRLWSTTELSPLREGTEETERTEGAIRVQAEVGVVVGGECWPLSITHIQELERKRPPEAREGQRGAAAAEQLTEQMGPMA